MELDKFAKEVNRVLGRIGDTPTEADVEALNNIKKHARFIDLDDKTKNMIDDILAGGITGTGTGDGEGER